MYLLSFPAGGRLAAISSLLSIISSKRPPPLTYSMHQVLRDENERGDYDADLSRC